MLETVLRSEDRQEDCCNLEGWVLAFGVQSFGDYLKICIDRSPLNQVEFAERVGLSKQQVTEMIKGRRSPNMKVADVWADALGLRGDDRELFLDLAVMCHIPKVARGRFLTFVDLVDQVRRERAMREDVPTPRGE